MARRIREQVFDDLTGKEVTEFITETFTVGSATYDVDLGTESARQYAAALEPFRAAAEAAAAETKQAERRAGRTTSSGATLRSVPPFKRQPTRVDKEQNRAIREWAAKNAASAGLEPPKSRGAIPKEIVAAFQRYEGRPVPSARRRSPKVSAAG